MSQRGWRRNQSSGTGVSQRLARECPVLAPWNPARTHGRDACATGTLRFRVLGPAGDGADFITEFAKMLQFVNQGSTTYTESFRRLRPIETVIAQRLQDGLVLDVFQTLRVGRFDGGGLLLERARARGQVF